MKAIFFCLLLAATKLLAAEPWPNLPYAEARAYYYNEAGLDGVPIINEGKLDPSVMNKNGTVVPPATLKALLDILNTKKFKSLTPGCYSPRHAVIFYDGNKKVVAVYEVCFGCMLQRSEPEGVAAMSDFGALAEIFEQLKLPIGPKGKTAGDVKKQWEYLFRIITLGSGPETSSPNSNPKK